MAKIKNTPRNGNHKKSIPKNRTSSRARTTSANIMNDLKDQTLKRMGLQIGIAHLHKNAYPEIRKLIKERLMAILTKAITVTLYRNRKTITPNDIMYTIQHYSEKV